MRSIYEASIWAPGAIPLDEWKYRNLKRIMFPVFDFFLFLGGLSAARYGIPAISEFFPEHFVDGVAYILSFAAFVCLVGVSFPRLWAFEIAGKVVVLSLLVGYVSALFILTAQGEDGRGFVLLIAAMAICPIVWRLSLLGTEWQARVLTRKQLIKAAQALEGD